MLEEQAWNYEYVISKIASFLSSFKAEQFERSR